MDKKMFGASTRNRHSDSQQTVWRLRWEWLRGPVAAANDSITHACAALFSDHYGKWGPFGPNPGSLVRMRSAQVRELLADEASWLACAYDGDQLIGYCVATRVEMDGLGRVDWVAQLVVHSSYRNARVATTLLYSIWQFSDCYAWGLVTANPFAVRALETATRRPCRMAEIRTRGPEVLRNVARHVRYLPPELDIDDLGRVRASVDTDFYLDHSELPKMLEAAARPERRWALGGLAEGHEWFACTFRHQPAAGLDDRSLAELLLGADGIWIQAYEGMTLDEAHAWHKYARDEVNFILTRTGAGVGDRVLDVGSGDGRHAIAMAKCGLHVVGIDIAKGLVERARHSYKRELETSSIPGTVNFEVGDAREAVPGSEYDVVICLYDVIGSSAVTEDDHLLLRNIINATKPGGYFVATVLNTTPTLTALPAERRPRQIADFVTSLEALPPSATMATSGSIFDPQYLLHFDGIYYRKEQFDTASWQLPAELVVRDKRYDIEELSSVIRKVGFAIIDLRPVQTNQWAREPALARTDERAKELLVLARRPQESAD